MTLVQLEKKVNVVWVNFLLNQLFNTPCPGLWLFVPS